MFGGQGLYGRVLDNLGQALVGAQEQVWQNVAVLGDCFPELRVSLLADHDRRA